MKNFFELYLDLKIIFVYYKAFAVHNLVKERGNMRPWSVLLQTVVFSAISVFAADGVRYKDRLFEVSDVKTVTVAQSVPFLTDNALANYNGLSVLMVLGEVHPMMYLYREELVDYSSLYMDIYEPKDDKETKRPVVLILHGGAFVAGTKESFDQKAVAYVDSLAARGFVTASLEYRLGVIMDQRTNLETGKTDMVVDSVDFARTVFKASQDVRAAVRYLRKNAEALKIDPEKIYLLGNSAGGMLALENIYVQTMDDFPSYITDDDSHYQRLVDGGKVPLGTLDSYGEQGFDGTANGVVSLWGAVHNLGILKNSSVPVFLTHGDEDDVVPYKKGHAISDVNAILQRNVSKEYKPIIDALNMNFDVGSPTLYGSYLIDSVLSENGTYHEFYNPTGYGLKHEYYDQVVEMNGESIAFEDSVQQKAFSFLYRMAIDSLQGKGLLGGGGPSVVLRPFTKNAYASSIVMGEHNLNFTVVRGENVSYAVFGLNGQRKLVGRASVGQTVDLSGLESGAYYLRVQGEKSRRIMITK